METTPSKYHSYLLRLWEVPGGQGAGWRASMEDVQTGELHGFQDLDALIKHLQGQAFEKQGVDVILEAETDPGN
jgi:hypothetical protein